MLNVQLCLATFALATAVLFGARVHAAERTAIPEKYTWNLADLYPSTAHWTEAREKTAKRIPEMAQFKGHLGDSSETLVRALTTMMSIDQELNRLGSYANQLGDEDTRISKNMELVRTVEQLAVDFHAAVAFLRPELLSLDAAKVRGFVNNDPRLREYRQFIDDIIRWKPHTRSPTEEKIVAQAGILSGAGESVFSVFTNADLPYPEVKLASGEKVRLDAAAFTRYRATPLRADRDKVFKAFFGAFRGFERTLGTSLYAQVRAHVFDKEVHRFGSSLEASLFANNIPTSVYRQLIADVHASLPTLHRYLRLRQRMMGLKDLRYDDLYAPIVKKVEMRFDPEQAMSLTLEAVAPLGREYGDTLKKGYESRWVDFLPSTGKRSGAYSNGSAYAVHPYQLLNFMGQYDDVSTLAHESGHSMHSALANKAQPYVTHDYSIFVAEVASTLNENLLLHHMLGKTHDTATRLFLLGSYLDNLRQTLFRQTMFAEFELGIHELVERGESLTGERLSELYLKVAREYYGHDQGVCAVAELYGVEWAYVPHFYYDFYVYQYATSLVASTSIAKGIRAEMAEAPPRTARRDAYLEMLASGSSKYPIELLKGAGVDMTTSAPFAAAMLEMNRVMDEMETLLGKSSNSK
jgi:oligoendopeptidase F